MSKKFSFSSFFIFMNYPDYGGVTGATLHEIRTNSRARYIHNKFYCFLGGGGGDGDGSGGGGGVVYLAHPVDATVMVPPATTSHKRLIDYVASSVVVEAAAAPWWLKCERAGK